MKRGRYCLIGAGAAGLGALQVLLEEGFSVDCFERSDRVGGHWHTDYECLHLITPRGSSGFDGFPMPSDYPLFPSRDQMRDYVLGFAAHPGLGTHIRFNTEVVSARPLDAGGLSGWEVLTSDGERNTYDGVIVANGHLWNPFVPQYPGRFDGHVVHSGAYRNAGDLHGDRVLVVGAGNSGCDLAVDAAQAAARRTCPSATASSSSPRRSSAGRGRSFPRSAGCPSACRSASRAASSTSASAGRSATACRHPPRAISTATALSSTASSCTSSTTAASSWRPASPTSTAMTCTSPTGPSARSTPSSTPTGFKATLPFLDPALIESADGAPLRVAGMTLPVGVEGLYFVGLAAPRGPQLPVYSAQARLIAKFLAVQERTPTPLAARLARSSRPESRIDIPRHEWTRDMRRTERRLARILRRTRDDGAPAPDAPGDLSPYLAIHG